MTHADRGHSKLAPLPRNKQVATPKEKGQGPALIACLGITQKHVSARLVEHLRMVHVQKYK